MGNENNTIAYYYKLFLAELPMIELMAPECK